MLTLYLLGDLRLERDGSALLTGRRKPLALLAFLARRGSRSSSREELASLLWGTGDDASARKSLRQCLSELRAVDGLTFVETDAGLSLTPNVLATDVDRFEADLRAGAWQPAVDSWKGDLIPAGESLGGPAWQHWLDGERVALRRRLALASDHLTTAAERVGDWTLALEAAARWRARLPSDSRGWCREIHGLQATGRIPEAIARASEGEHYFRNELGTAVPDDLARLIRVLGRVGHVSGTPAASLLTPDMVGRAGPMEALARARVAARLSESGQAVLIVAAEGLGKTRLVREFARSSRSSGPGVLVIESSANAGDMSRPFSFLQTVVDPLSEQDAIAGCAPETLATLAEVSPAVRAHFRHLPSSGTGDTAGALRSALAEVGRDLTIVLLLDDLPDVDAESQSAIAPLIMSPVAGVLVVATGRPDSWHGSTALTRASSRRAMVEHCSLEALNREESRAVLSSMAPFARATLDTLTPKLHRLSGGNPGLLTGLLTHLVKTSVLQADETGTWSSPPGAGDVGVPPAVEERWRDRYGEMVPDVRSVVDAAAILCMATEQRDAGVSELEELAELGAERFRAALEQARLAGVLRVSDARVSFAADLFRQLAYTSQTPSRQRAMHARAARRLRWAGDPRARAVKAAHRRHAGRRLTRRAVAAGLAGAGLLGVAAWYGGRLSSADVPPRTPVLLADVLNLTGDSSFDQTLSLAASVGLQQSRQVSLVPRSRVRETLALMQRAGADSILDEALAREVAVRENLRRVVHLTVAHVEGNYLVAGRIIDPSSGADLFAHQERVADRGEVLEALDRVLGRIRRGVGESVDSVLAFSVPLPRVTTGSLPALQAYATALRETNTRRYADAINSFLRAVELDSSFALAWLGLADLYYQQWNDRAGARNALANAERHADRLTERERLRLALASARYRGDAVEELRIAEALARRFSEAQTWHNLGITYLSRRRCPEAISAFEKALGFDSTYVAAHLSAATCHQFLGASDRAVAAYHRAWAVDSLSVYQGFQNHQFGVALVRGGMLDSARAVYARMIRRPASQDRQFGHRSLAHHAMWTGRWREADAQFDTAAQLAREAGTTLSVFRNRILQADLLTTAHQKEPARQALAAAWRLREQTAIPPAFAMYAGLAFVRGGQLDRARTMLRMIDASMQEASSDDRTVRAILDARIALAEHRVRAARTALESATDTTRSDYTIPALIDVWLSQGHRDSALVAAAGFERRAVFGIDAQDAWLRNLLLMGQIAEQLGRAEEATSAYARLESQLKTGDADHPLLTESRQGLARLAVTDGRRPNR